MFVVKCQTPVCYEINRGPVGTLLWNSRSYSDAACTHVHRCRGGPDTHMWNYVVCSRRRWLLLYVRTYDDDDDDVGGSTVKRWWRCTAAVTADIVFLTGGGAAATWNPSSCRCCRHCGVCLPRWGLQQRSFVSACLLRRVRSVVKLFGVFSAVVSVVRRAYNILFIFYNIQ